MTNNEAIELLIEDPTYDVRNDGTVWTIRSRNGRKTDDRWRQTGLTVSTKGYHDVGYIGKIVRVHRVIYRKFNGPLLAGYELDHKNDIKTDNRPENLQQILPAENNRKKKNRKIDLQQAVGIRILYAGGGIKQQEIADMYDIDQTYVSDIIRRKCFKDA